MIKLVLLLAGLLAQGSLQAREKSSTSKKQIHLQALAPAKTINADTASPPKAPETLQKPPGEDHSGKKEEKEWNFIVYMAANNNLHKYALKNFRQMLQVGSTATCNILVQLDEFGEKEANRFYIEKNKAVIVEELSGKEAISGTPESLFDFIRWATTSYPAKHQAIVLWNHGSGIKDPSIWGKLYKEHRDDLFSLDKETGLLHINRYSLRAITRKGIGFNDTHEQYLDNEQLKNCFSRIQTELLGGKKFEVILLDACHMAMVELASKFKFFANYMVASEELEPGSGYNYKSLLKIFKSESVCPVSLAEHAVRVYENEYQEQLADYTQSAISLKNFEECEQHLSNFSEYATNLMESNKDYYSLMKKIRRDDEETTEFCDWDYIDCLHFLESVSKKTQDIIKGKIPLKNLDKEELAQLGVLTKKAQTSLQESIIANTRGINLPFAQGLSIYFPEKNIHKSYKKTVFANTNAWHQFLITYLSYKKKKEFSTKTSHSDKIKIKTPSKMIGTKTNDT